MVKEISIERMLELEKIARENIMILKRNHTIKELDYIYLARKLPEEKIKEYFKKNKQSSSVDDSLFLLNMSDYLGVAVEELINRLNDLVDIEISRVSRNDMILLMLNRKRIFALEKATIKGISFLDFVHLSPVEKRYVRMAEDMPFSDMNDNEKISERINANSKETFWLRSFAYLQIKSYLLGLHRKGKLNIEDSKIAQSDIMARENREMVKRMRKGLYERETRKTTK